MQNNISSGDQYDIVVVGGGSGGISVTTSLLKRNPDLRIAIIESYPPGADTQPSYDDRGIALAYGTQRIFEALGIWPDVARVAQPIQEIHVSDRGHFGATRLRASEQGVPALGQVITARELGRVLVQRVADDATIDVIAPATVMPEIALDPDISGVCKVGGTLVMISTPTKIARGESKLPLVGPFSSTKSATSPLPFRQNY